MADINVSFENCSIECKNAISDRINIALEECAGELESQIKSNSRVDTGKTKNSFRHHLNKMQHIAYIGSPDQNAVWEEYGTGEYALNNDGRKGGWYYHDEKDGKFHHTYGKTPTRALHHAFKQNETILKEVLKSQLGSMK